MPLPDTNEPWPPAHLDVVYSKMAEWSAWYSGDPERIIDVYALHASQPSGQVPWWRFWSRARQASAGAQRAMLHVPVASDLASLSGALLFGKPPRIRIKEAHESETPDPAEAATDEPTRAKPETPEQRAEARMLQFVEDGDVVSRLIEAAESAAAMGGVFIYPAWDTDLRPFPILAVAQSDMAVPEFQHGFLTAVTFHRIVSVDGERIFRHLERHEVEGTGASRQAVVLHRLYEGTLASLGEPRELAASPATIRLQPRVELPFPELDVQYVPNIRPNRLWRSSGFGVADIQGSESLLDAIDEVYASWMRDVRLAKARLLVPREYLRANPESDEKEPVFDLDHEVYTAMDMEPTSTADARSIIATQFEIRYLEHRATARDLVERVVSNAGYAPTTMAQMTEDGSSRTGTALRISEHKTILTLRKKSAWWRSALASVLYHMAVIDEAVFDSGVPAIRPTVDLADAVIDQPLELAQTALALKSAESASIETRVRLVNPDWSDAEVDSEVRRLKDESAAVAEAKAEEARAKFGMSGTDAASTGNLPTGADQAAEERRPV